MKAITLWVFLFSFSICCIANSKEDLIPASAKSDTIGDSKEWAIEISKIGYNKTFLLKNGRNVWMYFPNEKGKNRVKKAKIISIGEHEITVRPYNNKFKETVFLDSEITFIGFTSAGRIIIAVFVTILLLFLILILLFIAALAGAGGGADFFPFYIIPFRKNIKLEQTKNGYIKWELRIVETQNKKK
jgi:hypothetical protein